MLNMQNVTKTFGDFTALNNLSMHVPKGAVYGLVGPNGAGKSTAIRCLLGVYKPDKGTVMVDSAPVFENPAVKERIGSIPDDVFHFPTATLEDMRKFRLTKRTLRIAYSKKAFDALIACLPEHHARQMERSKTTLRTWGVIR